MFKKAASVEEFEQLINNGFQSIISTTLILITMAKPIKCNRPCRADAHAFVLQVAVSNWEQDIAVIELEKTVMSRPCCKLLAMKKFMENKMVVEADGKLKRRGRR